MKPKAEKSEFSHWSLKWASEKQHTYQHSRFSVSIKAWQVYIHHRCYQNENILLVAEMQLDLFAKMRNTEHTILSTSCLCGRVCMIIIDGYKCLTGKSIEQIGNCQLHCFKMPLEVPSISSYRHSSSRQCISTCVSMCALYFHMYFHA